MLAQQVQHLGVVFERLEAMRTSLRDVDRFSVVRREFHANPLKVTRRFRTQIDSDVIHRTSNAAHDFRFCVWCNTVVQASKRSAAPVVRQADLGDLRIETVGPKLVLAPDTRKESTLIQLWLELDKEDAV